MLEGVDSTTAFRALVAIAAFKPWRKGFVVEEVFDVSIERILAAKSHEAG